MCGNLYSKAIDKFEDIQNGQTSIVTGEILGDGDTTDTTIYEYDVFNRMDTMLNGSYEWTFEYNADGQRVSKSNGIQSLEYIWDGNNIVSEKNENNQSTYFQRGLSLLTMEREQDNFKHYYFKNAHGDVTGVVDTRTNTIKYSYDYDAFGNQIFNSATNTNIFSSGYNGEVEDTNPFRYAGEYFDRETGMIYLRNRYYIPDYGRFTQQDPIFDGTNWYVYCGNNPVIFVDTFGLKMILSGSDEEKQQIYNNLQLLTRDELYYEVGDRGSWVIHYNGVDGDNLEVGTNLVRRIIDNQQHACLIVYTDSYDIQTEILAEQNASNPNIGSPVTILYNPNFNPDVLTEYTDKDGQVGARLEKAPSEIVLGHELIHGLRTMGGNRIKEREFVNYEHIRADGWFGRKGKTTSSDALMEELATTGISYRRLDGTWADAANWVTTENALRKEHGYGRRVKY